MNKDRFNPLPSDTPEQRRRKQNARLLISSMLATLRSAPSLQEIIKSCPSSKPIQVDEERFGKAPKHLQQPLLQDRRGKGTRKQRKAAKAKSKPPEPLGSPQLLNQVSWDTQDGVERKYYASVTGRLAPKSGSSNH